MNYNLTLFIDFFQKRVGLVIFIFSSAIIFGPAFGLFSEYSYDLAANPDIDTYLNLAEFNFDQSPVRKYRIIVPFLAAGVNFLLEPIFSLLVPHSFPGPNFSLCMSFLLVNTLLMSLFGVVAYFLCKNYKTSTTAALIGLLSILTCRWTAYLSGLPIVDSLYVLIIAVTLLGIKTNNSKLIILSILIGPWTKESYLFIAPLIFIYSSMDGYKQVGWFALSGILVFTFRYYFDVINGIQMTESLERDLDTIHQIIPSIKKFFSFHGAYELFSIIGFWNILFLALLHKKTRTTFKIKSPKYSILFVLIILFHAFLSTDLARMFYLLTPLFAIWIAIIFDELLNIKNNIDSHP